MAVTIDTTAVARTIRAVDSAETSVEITSLLEYATAEVLRIAPNAPDAVHNRSAIAICGYLYDRPTAAAGAGYANVVRNSGASSMLLPYRIH